MSIDRSLFSSACRTAAFTLALAGIAATARAQQTVSVQTVLRLPTFVASAAAPFDLFTAANSSSSSSDFDGSVAGDDSAQPPPRRTYGRPNYSDSHTNPDGSSKYTFFGAVGLGLPIGNTYRYETPSYGYQVGFGRNFNKNVGVDLQYDYDHFGLQGSTLANETTIYDYGCSAAAIAAGVCGVSGLDGNNHVWSFTLDPIYNFSTSGAMGAYVVAGGGFYHKVTNFTEPTTEEECFYFCEEVGVNANIDHYTSNAGGFNGGFGLTYKFSKFSGERFYAEARYVVTLNEQRYGYTVKNFTTTTYNGTNFYPANSNRTTYIPVKFGIRF